MKCLSIRQPWAFAILQCGKDVENRDWPTNFRGRLAIHAGKRFDVDKTDWLYCWGEGMFGEPWTSLNHKFGAIGGANDVRGAIVGTVEVYDCITDRVCGSPWKAEGFEFYCWLLRNPRALREPIPYTGRLGLFDIPWSEEGLFSTDTGVEEVLRRA